jgi:hypothetical protein
VEPLYQDNHDEYVSEEEIIHWFMEAMEDYLALKVLVRWRG